MNDNCLFCKIAAGAIPSTKVYEDDNVLAFLDIAPVEKGHTLVISKRIHSEALIETPNDVLSELCAAARKIGSALMKAGFGGFNVVQNNYPDGGQAIPHIHLHVIPRIKGRTAPLAWASNSNPYADAADRDAFAARIRASLV
jgi:histidine triad (HIT) family protein